MKLYKKSDLKFCNGMIVSKDGDVINVDPQVTVQANLLETKMQEQGYLDAQPKACPKPTLDGFERKSIIKKIKIRMNTPLLDKKIEESMALMDEIDADNACKKIENMANAFKELVAWVDSDEVLSMDNAESVSIFDTPVLGDPLKLTSDDIIAGVAIALGIKVNDIVPDKSDE